MENKRKKIAFYTLTSCYGCQLQLAMMDEVKLLFEHSNVVCWYMLDSNSHEHEPVDIALVEGSVSTEKDIELIKEIRENAKIVVGVGSCALHGGVQAWDGEKRNINDLWEDVYGRKKIKLRPKMAKPIDEYIKVDYKIYGCPPEKRDFIYTIGTLLKGTWPEDIDYPVCIECRMKGNPCILIEKGELCLGPVTRAGCDARCPNFGVACIGCRGAIFYDVAWFDALARVFRDKGYSKEEIMERFKMFNAYDKRIDEMVEKVLAGGGKK